jgi:hypothetical protein
MKDILKYVHLNFLLAVLVSNEFMSYQEISVKTWPFLVVRIIFAVCCVLCFNAIKKFSLLLFSIILNLKSFPIRF